MYNAYHTSMSDLHADIAEDLRSEILTMNAIAKKHNVPISWVFDVWETLCFDEHDIDMKLQ